MKHLFEVDSEDICFLCYILYISYVYILYISYKHQDSVIYMQSLQIRAQKSNEGILAEFLYMG